MRNENEYKEKIYELNSKFNLNQDNEIKKLKEEKLILEEKDNIAQKEKENKELLSKLNEYEYLKNEAEKKFKYIYIKKRNINLN